MDFLFTRTLFCQILQLSKLVTNRASFISFHNNSMESFGVASSMYGFIHIFTYRIYRGIGRIITFMLSSLRVFYVKLMLVNRVFDWLWRARSTTRCLTADSLPQCTLQCGKATWCPALIYSSYVTASLSCTSQPYRISGGVCRKPFCTP